LTKTKGMIGIKSISLEELKQWKMEERNFQLVDVREDSERTHFNIGGDWIPLADIVNQKDKINTNKPVVFYCKRGIRSQIAIQKLKFHMQSSEFYNLKGGIYPLL
jgi:rhodanese-related sulfurtransferase